MRRLPRWLWQRLHTTGGDRGATLIYALVFITSIALAIAGVLTLVDANLRATRALRHQAATAQSADGAAQIAIDTLRRSWGNCFNGSNTLTLNNFYPMPAGGRASAVVTCELDPGLSTTAGGLPGGAALITLGTGGSSTSLNVRSPGFSPVHISGSVIARSQIQIGSGTSLQVSGGTVRASNACTGSITPTASCNDPTVGNPDPNYPTPPAPPSADIPTIPSCDPTAQVMTFQPGRYRLTGPQLNQLNTAMSCPFTEVFDFRPGVYYFSFNGPWTISHGTLVGGAPGPLGTPAPAVPGACPNPVTNPVSGAGVQFVFGGGARMNVTGDARVELCGRSSTSAPSIVFYGLDSGIGGGATRVPALSGCATQITDNTCAGVLTTDGSSPNARIYAQGVVYAPTAKIRIASYGSGGASPTQFTGGVVARLFRVDAPTSAVSAPLVRSYGSAIGESRTVNYLTVYVCPMSSTCSAASGTLRLKVKVGITDPLDLSFAGQRQVTVYSWSVQA